MNHTDSEETGLFDARRYFFISKVNLMNIRNFAVLTAITSISGMLMVGPTISYADTLIMNNNVACSNISTVNWTNDQLVITCNDSVIDAPVNQPPTVVPPVVKPPVTDVPVNQLPVDVTCPNPEPEIRTERFTGKGIDKEFTLENETALVVPFNSGNPGEVQKIALGEPGAGEHFKKTVIISKCPGVYNPQDYDFRSSVDECVVTGLELSFSVIAGESRSDYPLSSYRCVLSPNQQYYINVFQRFSGNRPPFKHSAKNTCRTNRCGVRVSIR